MYKLVDFKYKTYLIGAMEVTAEGDSGQAKRSDVEKALLELGVYPINPCFHERCKTGMAAADTIAKHNKWIEEDRWAEFIDSANHIWKGRDYLDAKGMLVHIPGDFDYVEMSNWITCLYTSKDRPVGTFGEMFQAYKLNIPVYVITDVSKKKLRHSFLHATLGSGGEVFATLSEYINFIRGKYNLNKIDIK